MKKVLFALAALTALAACANKQAEPATEGHTESTEVAFQVAENYFFKNGQAIPDAPKVTTEADFNALFGMAATMGDHGTPTAIDFTKQMVLAIVLPVTDFATDIKPVRVEARGDSLFYTYKVVTGEKQTYSIQPLCIITIDKQYEDRTVVLVNEYQTTYLPAVDRYLVEEIGSQYAKGDYCVPLLSIVAVDERNAEDILVWGDFWVFNYNLVGDTLKCVSGGSHPGLMHIRPTGGGQSADYEVTAFDQVEDGSRYQASAKKIFGDKYDAFAAINSDDQKRKKLRSEGLAAYAEDHGLAATLYQDYGWPARKLGE